MLLATLVGGIRLEGDAPMNGSAEKAGKTQVLNHNEPSALMFTVWSMDWLCQGINAYSSRHGTFQVIGVNATDHAKIYRKILMSPYSPTYSDLMHGKSAPANVVKCSFDVSSSR